MFLSGFNRHCTFIYAIVVLTLHFYVSSKQAQFISHINAKGLKGNITFDIRDLHEGKNGSFLVIESIIESDPLNRIKDDINSDDEEPVLFDWAIHYNTLDHHMLRSCSDEELGASISDSLKSSLANERQIVLNKLNSWTIPLSDLIQSKPIRSLSALLWGKSVRIKLSSTHNESLERLDPKSSPSTIRNSTASNASQSGTLRTPGLVKPSISVPTGIAPVPAQKPPTFAPRPKPSISNRLKSSTPAPMLPQPEALVSENDTSPDSIEGANSTLSSTGSQPSTISPKPKQSITLNLNNLRRIIKAYGKIVVCGNIVDTRNVKTVEAVFESQISGKVTIRGNEDEISLIALNLYHVKSKVTSRHDWKILASDILDERRHDEKCKYLQTTFDLSSMDDSGCKRDETSKCRMGDLTKKHGQVQVAGKGKSGRTYLVDLNLPLSALESSRSLYLVIYDSYTMSNQKAHQPNILSCSLIRSNNARKVEAIFNMDGVRGSIKMFQRHSTEPTVISYDLFGLEGNIKHLTVRQLPLGSRMSSDNSKLCNSLGDVYNPFGIEVENRLQQTTVDSFPVGNLTAKHGQLSVIDSEYEDHYMGEYMDLSVQLFGLNTLVGRSIVIHKNNGENWVCSNLDYTDEDVSIAVAYFYYPVVGKITFQQLSNNPHSETGVLVEVYNPNSDKESNGHNWMIHLKPALADFYNWSQRCESSGEVYDPLQAAAGLSTELYTRQCITGVSNEPLKCRSGDLSLKSGYKLNLPVSHMNRTRFYYNDPFLPLDGSHTIIAKSLVIYDENAPTQRGTRLACSTIKSVHSLRASIKEWNSGPSIPSTISGSVIFEQTSSNRPTKIKIDLSGFNGNVENYAIHNVWTMDDREFPCSNDSLYDIYDPFDNEHSQTLPPSAHYGSLATVDRVKVGDMSRKHGTFEGLQGVQRSLSDANVPLFAPQSIIGRSLVLRAAVNDFRWVCGNIELDYDKSKSREIVAIASFDEPRSKIAGYVRFVQLEHKDGSLSDTYIQINLKMQSDGIHELQTSEAHNWAVFVNQVGEDAFIVADEVRCIAAGFKWNPYLAQDSLDSYAKSCTSSEQLACAMGDLGMRHGLLTLGPNNRRSVSDSNLPLVGNYSVMGRSLIIFDNKRPSVKLACANIFPDIHLKSNVVIKRTPSFTVAKFIEQMRSLLGAAEWLMVPELKATKPVANGECVQMTIHFYGQKAHQMQVELNNLISLGTVRRSTRIGVDKITTNYRLCRIGQMQLTSSAGSTIRFIEVLINVGLVLTSQTVAIFLMKNVPFTHIIM